MSKENQVRQLLIELIPSVTESDKDLTYKLGQVIRVIPKQTQIRNSTRTNTFF